MILRSRYEFVSIRIRHKNIAFFFSHLLTINPSWQVNSTLNFNKIYSKMVLLSKYSFYITLRRQIKFDSLIKVLKISCIRESNTWNNIITHFWFFMKEYQYKIVSISSEIPNLWLKSEQFGGLLLTSVIDINIGCVYQLCTIASPFALL